MRRVFHALLFLLALPILPLHWLYCRLTAEPCPCCGSPWQTECQGEWDGDETWCCNACGHYWGVRA